MMKLSEMLVRTVGQSAVTMALRDLHSRAVPNERWMNTPSAMGHIGSSPNGLTDEGSLYSLSGSRLPACETGGRHAHTESPSVTRSARRAHPRGSRVVTGPGSWRRRARGALRFLDARRDGDCAARRGPASR